MTYSITIVSLLLTLSNNFRLTKLLLPLRVLNTTLLFYSFFGIIAYSNGFIASFSIFIQFSMYISNTLIMDGM